MFYTVVRLHVPVNVEIADNCEMAGLALGPKFEL